MIWVKPGVWFQLGLLGKILLCLDLHTGIETGGLCHKGWVMVADT